MQVLEFFEYRLEGWIELAFIYDISELLIAENLVLLPQDFSDSSYSIL